MCSFLNVLSLLCIWAEVGQYSGINRQRGNRTKYCCSRLCSQCLQKCKGFHYNLVFVLFLLFLEAFVGWVLLNHFIWIWREQNADACQPRKKLAEVCQGPWYRDLHVTSQDKEETLNPKDSGSREHSFGKNDPAVPQTDLTNTADKKAIQLWV